MEAAALEKLSLARHPESFDHRFVCIVLEPLAEAVAIWIGKVF